MLRFGGPCRREGVLVDAFMVLGWVRMVSAEGPLAGGRLWDVGALERG